MRGLVRWRPACSAKAKARGRKLSGADRETEGRHIRKECRGGSTWLRLKGQVKRRWSPYLPCAQSAKGEGGLRQIRSPELRVRWGKEMKRRRSDRSRANKLIKAALRKVGFKYHNMDQATADVCVAYGIENGGRIAVAQTLREMAGQQRKPQARSRPREEDKLKAFYRSWEWKRLRYDVLKKRGRKCECCGSAASDGFRIVVDHIKAIRNFWHIRLDEANCQVLCNDCNMGKGSRDETDWRPTVTEACGDAASFG